MATNSKTTTSKGQGFVAPTPAIAGGIMQGPGVNTMVARNMEAPPVAQVKPAVSQGPTGGIMATPTPMVSNTPTAVAASKKSGGGYTKKDFPYDEYLKAFPELKGGSKVDQHEYDRAWAKYQADGGKWKPDVKKPTKPTKPTTPTTPTVSNGKTTIVPGNADTKDKSQINVVDYTSQVAADPDLFFRRDNKDTKGVNESMLLSSRVGDKDNKITESDIKKGLIDKKGYGMDYTSKDTQVQGKPVDTVKNRDAQGYQVATTYDQIKKEQLQGAKGKLSDGSVIGDDEIAQHDLDALARGEGALGQALGKYATQSLSTIIDTSTPSGRALAEQLGEGNYVDAKATVAGQLQLLQAQFTGPNGEPVIPAWAQGAARNVSKIAAFSGMSGTAATAAMSQAIMEASLPIAQSDAQFFQTLTIQNLNNKQQSTINTANILAKMAEQNVDNRMAAAIQNAKSFLEMDLTNLNNDQQARVINNQNRVQSILEDAKAKNTERMFEAQSQNEMDMFYDQLNSQIKQFNSAQSLDAQKFNSTMADSREKFYKEMKFNIDLSNAKWRQTVQLQEDQQAFEAATTDVKNMVDISTSMLNQIWDRSDALLDYLWKSSENEKDRQNKLAQLKLGGKIQSDQADKEGIGKLVGTFIGSDVGQKVIGSVFDGLW